MIHTFSVQTRSRTDFINITSQIQRIIDECDLKDGTCVVYVPHTTAAVTINENADPHVMEDIGMILDKVVPWHDKEYKHSEGNSAAHVKSSITGSSEILCFEAGKLVLGTWQSVYFCECDGQRMRKVHVRVSS